MTFVIRTTRREDVPTILRLVRELAAYEDASESVRSTEPMLEQALFGTNPSAEALIAEMIDSAATVTPIGYAVFYTSFSTWTGRCGIWLDDLYVSMEARGSGAGAAMLKAIANIAVDRDCARFEWWVLDWNTAAVEFYRAKGAVPQNERTVYRVSDDALLRLAGRL